MCDILRITHIRNGLGEKHSMINLLNPSFFLPPLASRSIMRLLPIARIQTALSFGTSAAATMPPAPPPQPSINDQTFYLFFFVLSLSSFFFFWVGVNFSLFDTDRLLMIYNPPLFSPSFFLLPSFTSFLPKLTVLAAYVNATRNSIRCFPTPLSLIASILDSIFSFLLLSSFRLFSHTISPVRFCCDYQY